jgi:SsrA-binding protein
LNGEAISMAEEVTTITVNRQAYHDYFVDETYEAGIALTGTEIKSIRGGRANLRGAYARIKNGEMWIEGMHVATYDQGTYMNHDPLRNRKLLMHRRQIAQLDLKVQAKGLTLVPLKLYITHNRAKVEIGFCRGKKMYDKRETIAHRDADREIARATKVGARR